MHRLSPTHRTVAGLGQPAEEVALRCHRLVGPPLALGQLVVLQLLDEVNIGAAGEKGARRERGGGRGRCAWRRGAGWERGPKEDRWGMGWSCECGLSKAEGDVPKPAGRVEGSGGEGPA